VPELPSPAPSTEDVGLRRRQIRHDINHQLGTVMMLASVVAGADDIGPASRARIEQILGEARWLDQLLRAFEGLDERTDDELYAPERISVDTVVGEVVAALRLATMTAVTFVPSAAWSYVDRLALWRSVRNVMDNAFRAAGTSGHVKVRVTAETGWTTVQVDDDGPGFGSGPSGLASLGLGIVQDFVAQYGGRLEISQGELGGGCVRIQLPAAPPPLTLDGASWEASGDAGPGL
jgi:signal transduction histidine kinase